MDKKWHRNEEYWILRIRYYVELKQGKELKETLEQIQQEHIYLSAKGKEALAFWQDTLFHKRQSMSLIALEKYQDNSINIESVKGSSDTF